MQIENLLQKSTRFCIGLIVLFTFLLAGCGRWRWVYRTSDLNAIIPAQKWNGSVGSTKWLNGLLRFRYLQWYCQHHFIDTHPCNFRICYRLVCPRLSKHEFAKLQPALHIWHFN